MRTLLTIINTLIIVLLLTISCTDSNGDDDGRDPSSGNGENTANADAANGRNGDADVLNECQKEKEIRLEAIREQCAGYVDCCYCSCELTDEPSTGCDCRAWVLLRDQETEPCDRGWLNQAIQCLSNEASCIEQTRAVTDVRCY